MSDSSNPSSRKRAESFTEPSSVLDAAKLLYILRAIDPKIFVDRLLHRVHPHSACSPDSLSLLIEALKANGFESEVRKAEAAVGDSEERHCLRCHTSYQEKDNARDACVIRHAYPVVATTASSGGLASDANGNVASCPSCHSSVPGASSCVVTPTCFAGRHTTNPHTAYASKSPVVKTCKEAACSGSEGAVKPLASTSRLIESNLLGTNSPKPQSHSSNQFKSQGDVFQFPAVKAALNVEDVKDKENKSDKESKSVRPTKPLPTDKRAGETPALSPDLATWEASSSSSPLVPSDSTFSFKSKTSDEDNLAHARSKSDFKKQASNGTGAVPFEFGSNQGK